MEDDLAEVKPIKFPSSTLATDGPCSTSTKRLTPDSKPAKKWLKTDGYEKTGQHSSNLEHVKEKHVKGQESLNQLKSFTAQRTTRNQRHVKFKRRDQDEIGVICSTNLVNDFLKKPKTFSRNAETTMLILKFPPKSILPSISELKAKFIRFGPLHLSDTHISWKSLTCFVAFKCEYDALAAYEHGVRNNFLFGNTYVKYQLHTAKVPDLESHKSGEQLMKQTPEKGPNLTTMSPGGSAQPEMPSKSCMNFSMAYEEDYTTTPTLHASHGNLQKSIPLCYPLPCHGLGVICNYEVDQLVEDCNAQYREAGAINTCIFTF
ncbi:Tudor/PWWP/MBT superfamily protein [Quillaja saponaria]|uniref:Tudor/PWWP/MBT superfamily protein n=1 Tax=Quillaja saponaria TaxID=32244 RepID=A0AAD7PGU2_QUISA|nr:Tudor/PWWP/MBT superfamily protein [Quillaja saponaria]